MKKEHEAPPLESLDRKLKRVAPVGPTTEGTQIRIELRCGFELFNTRPYHNYESWSHGWYIDGMGVHAEAEDLEQAVTLFVTRAQQAQDGEPLKPWERGLKFSEHTKPLPPE